MSFTQGMWRQHHQRLKAAGKGPYSVYLSPYHHGRRSPFGEMFARHGCVVVTRNQRALLKAIASQPEQSFPTIRAWVAATAESSPALNREGLHRCVRRLPEIWVSRTRIGARKFCALQARGRVIAEGEIPVWLKGERRIDREAVEIHADQSLTPVAEVTYPVPCQSEPGLGQLLDNLDRAADEGVDPSDEAAAMHASRVVEAEVELSVWRARYECGEADVGSTFAALACAQLPKQEAVEEFVATVGSIALQHASEAARHALSFPYGWQRLLALEEVVLSAEVRAWGLAEVAARRRRSREEALEALKARLVDVLPETTPDSGDWKQ